jgi:hypothetical protein
MLDFITNKIIKDKTSLIIADGDENNIKLFNKNTMIEKLKEFKQIETLCKKYYDPKIIRKILFSKQVQS